MILILPIFVLCCFQFQVFTSAQGISGCSYAYLEHPVDTLSCNPYPNGLLKLRCKVVGPLNVHLSISWFWEDAGGVVRELERSSKYNIRRQENFGVTGDLELGERRFSLLNVASLSDSDRGFYSCQIKLGLANGTVVFLKPSNTMKVHPQSLYESLNYQTCSNEAQTTMEPSCADLNNVQVLEHQTPCTTHTTFTANVLSSYFRIEPTLSFSTQHTGINIYTITDQGLQPTSERHLAHTGTHVNHRSASALTTTIVYTGREVDPPVEPSVSALGAERWLYVLIPLILVLSVAIPILSIVTAFNVRKKRKERRRKKGVCGPDYPQLPVSERHCSQHQPTPYSPEDSGQYIDVTAVSPVKECCMQEKSSDLQPGKPYKQLDINRMEYTSLYVTARLHGRVCMLEGGNEYAAINTREKDPVSLYTTAKIMHQQGTLN